MPPTRISLARIRELRVPVSWQEAVAVARAAGEVSLGTGHGASLDTCHVAASGAVEIVGGSRRNGSLRTPVFSLLSALLEGRPAPDALRALVASHKPESDDVLMDFPSEDEPDQGDHQLHDLSFFARPNAGQLIAALATRALAAAAEDDARKAAEPPVVETPAPVPPEEAAPREWTLPAIPEWARQFKPVTLTIAAVAMVGIAWVVLSRSAAGTTMQAANTSNTAPAAAAEASPRPVSEAAPPPTADPVSSRAVNEPAPTARIERSERDQPALRTVSPAPPQRAESIAAAPARVSNPDLPASLPAPSNAEAVQAAPAPIDLPAMSALTTGPAPAAPSEAVDDTAEPFGSTPIYSAQDPDVVPPVMLRPQIPSEPRADTEPSHAEIELVVNAEGVVTQVRLRSTGELSLNDRMLVAAAKAWQFRPAYRNGRPVSYALRIPVTP